MNYDDIVKKLMHGEKIYNLPLKVTYYCRVSTDSEIQLNSLNNQLDYYINFIKSKTNWTLVDGYIEEGITGVTVDKRTSFKQMIKDAKEKKFNLIITKEVSRFARDLEDSIHYIRKLKSYGVGLFFENQNLNTFDENSELILNIMFNLAQEESKKLSSRVKFGHKQAIKKGHVLGSSNITGYKKDKCKLVIVEKEAKFIRKVFELYATGKYGLYKLSSELGKLNYYNKNNNLYDKETLKRIIENPKYKGYYRAHTYEIMDYRTKRRIKNHPSKQIIYKCLDNSIPPIVSEELWDKANKILNTRKTSYQHNNFWSGGLKYPFSSKIYCKEHNTNFQRTCNKKRSNPKWCCRLYMQYRLKACISPIISEIALYNIMSKIMDNIILEKDKLIYDTIRIYDGINKKNNYSKELKMIDKDITFIENKKSLALDLVLNGNLQLDDLKKQIEKLSVEEKNLINRKKEILNNFNITKNKLSSNDIIKAIENEINGGILEEFIRNFVDKIIVSKLNNNRYNIKLEIFLNLAGNIKSCMKDSNSFDELKENYILYLKDKKYSPKQNKEKNIYTYDVYTNILY